MAEEGRDPFRELREALEAKVAEGEFPDWLAVEVLRVAADPGAYGAEAWLVELLAAQVREFSVYADTGCCKFGFDHEDVKRTLRQLEERTGRA